MLSDNNEIKLKINKKDFPKYLEIKQHNSKWHINQRSIRRKIKMFELN